MTHTPVRLTSVLFGFLFTIVVAVAPLAFVLIPHLSDVQASKTPPSSTADLSVIGFTDLPSVATVAVAGIFAVAVAIVIARFKADHSRW